MTPTDADLRVLAVLTIAFIVAAIWIIATDWE